MTIAFFTTANPTRQFIIKDDCTGSPNCVAEIQIESQGSLLATDEANAKAAPSWQEAHLNYVECKAIRRTLKKSMKAWKAERKG